MALLLAVILPGVRADPPAAWRQPRLGTRLTEVGVDRTVAHGGKASGFIKATQPDPFAFGVCRQWIRATRYRGKRIRLAAYLRTVDTGPSRRSGARLDLLVFSATHRFGGAAMRGRLIHGTTGWTRYDRVIDVPKEAALLAIDVVLAGPGQVWVDDVTLEVVGADVPTTARCERRAELAEEIKQRLQTRLQEAPRRPINLDFER
jgi:hypothetical protein